MQGAVIAAEVDMTEKDGIPDDFATCPPEVRAVLDARLASLDRGEGLTTDQLREQLRAWKEERRPCNGPR